jgi:RNA polymerase sigma-70 factor (ECF subfamily)
LAARLARTNIHRAGVEEIRVSPVRALARPNPVVLSDAELMDEIIGGSADAFGELYDRYSARAFRVARSVCRDRGAAEDAVQEAFVSIFKSRTAYRSQRGTVAAWVLMVVLSRAIDVSRVHARRATRRASDDALADLSAPGDVIDQAGARIDAGRVRTALAALPEAQREAITLAYYGELTHTEIAERLGLPFGTVKGRIRLGLNKLRLDFEPAGSSEG